MTVILDAQSLTRRFGDVVAVDRATLTVGEGEVFGLLGRNGAGKSTLIKMLTTLLPPSSGSARVAGFDLAREPARVRRAIGYVPQALSADSELTGFENLDVFARLYDIPRRVRDARIAEALRLMDLTEVADRLVNTYSGGMVRRLEVAQSMLHRPRILFLDEPTIGLDPLARETIWQHIEELHSTHGTAIFLTTHYMDEAAQLSHRVAIMRRGAIVVTGTPAALCEELGQRGQAEATLDDVFVHYTEDERESDDTYRETAGARRAASRLG
ncbi:MAG: ATP-binding cassette domain-containing protein [Mizugakiibacter sp.]|uniref:ABC transporter ATP-binding protein n=1 Tax=Mizugakiibacter sp. TaxID=1972610 RepID=UPI0031C7D82A|nr:ATP-binding cassette domain-containing protein [Xanthomonadaceae bacterium]